MHLTRPPVPVAIIFTTTVHAVAIPFSQFFNGQGLGLSKPVPSFSSIASPQNITANVLINGTAISNMLHTDCDQNLYGAPIVKSCLDVYTQISDDDTVREFGDRTKGYFKYALPYRISSTDGKCILDVSASPGYTEDKASMAQISAGALSLLNTCILPEQAGGRTTGYGQNGGLSLTFEEYAPNVICQQEVSRYSDRDIDKCHDLLSLMPATEDVQVFGKAGDRGVQVPLPFDLPQPDGSCGFYFNGNGRPTRDNWHDLWAAATAIWGICGRKQQQGIAFAGPESSISIAMYRPNDDESENTLKSQAIGAPQAAQ